jgi:hypothetical protein
MGILKRHQECVCVTKFTDIPGKNHSKQWQNVNNKINRISELKKSCSDKS